MKFCSKCGAKMPDGAKFCANCGQTAEGIKAETGVRKKSKTPLILGIAAGVLSAAVIVVCALIGAGVIGGAGEGAGTAQQPEGQSGQTAEMNSTETPVSAALEATPTSTQAPETSKENQMRCAWEAYSAYIEEINSNSMLKSYRDNEEDADDEAAEWSRHYSLFYMDSDDYPELICGMDGMAKIVLMTYKNGEVTLLYGVGGEKGVSFVDYVHPWCCSCKERQNILYANCFVPSGGGFNYEDFYSIVEGDSHLEEVWLGAESNLNDSFGNPEVREITANGSVREVKKGTYKKEVSKIMGDKSSWLQLTGEPESDTDSYSGAMNIYQAWYVFAERCQLFLQ